MDTVLGLLGLLVYMAVILALASGVTWLVVKLSPSKSQKQLEAKQQRAAG
jgi:flagellar biogenesis protein FliO